MKPIFSDDMPRVSMHTWQDGNIKHAYAFTGTELLELKYVKKYKSWCIQAKWTENGYVHYDAKGREKTGICTYLPSIAYDENWHVTKSCCLPIIQYIKYILSVVPQAKYWRAKWPDFESRYSSLNTNMDILSKMLRYKNIPEMETLLYNYPHCLEGGEIPKRWGKLKHTARRVWMKYIQNGICIQVTAVMCKITKNMYIPEIAQLNKAGMSVITMTEIPLRNLLWFARRFGTQRDTVSQYCDMLSMAKINGHDISVDYYSHNQNWMQLHDQLQQEERELHNRRNANQIQQFQERYGKWDNRQMTIDDYVLYTSSDLQLWETRSNKLQQCCYRAGYWTKERSVLIFVDSKDSSPVATAEIKDGVLVQYRKEQSNYLSSSLMKDDYMVGLINTYMDTYKFD